LLPPYVTPELVAEPPSTARPPPQPDVELPRSAGDVDPVPPIVPPDNVRVPLSIMTPPPSPPAVLSLMMSLVRVIAEVGGAKNWLSAPPTPPAEFPTKVEPVTASCPEL
jgi:hypothetical protein